MITVKIGFLVDKIVPEYVGGYEARVWSFAVGLSRTHEVRVYTSLAGSNSMTGQNPMRCGCHPRLAQRRVAGRSLPHSFLFSAGLLADPIEDWSPEVLVIEAIPYLHLYLARRWIAKHDCPKILDVVEAWATYAPREGALSFPSLWLVRKLLASGLHWADRAIVPSRVTARSLVTNYSYDSVDIIPTGIQFKEPQQEVVKNQDAATYDFVTVGRLSPEKRQRDMLEALGILRSQGWKGRALVVGTGRDADTLVGLTRKLDIEPQVEFAGFVTNELKLEFLNKSRIFVLCSEREGQSIATLEALSCGLPAIVAKPREPEVFAVAELVSEGSNGLHYSTGNVHELAKCMSTLLSDRTMRLRYARESLAVARHFDWDEILGTLERSLTAVVNRA